MNFYCCKLGLKASLFDSPHGLANKWNMSTALDIALISAECLKDPQFVKIANTKIFKVPKTESNNNQVNYRWENTHKMIGQKGIIAVKTGWTPAAGSCLATASDMAPGVNLIIVVV